MNKNTKQEIERKFLIEPHNLPQDLAQYPCHHIEQAYLCTDPVLRIRRQDDAYYLTCKSKGHLSREEYNLPLTEEAYHHLLPKADGVLISKTRYLLPETGGYTIELDVFAPPHAPLMLAEVEFPSEEAALAYNPPAWFSREVTYDNAYHNSALSRLT